MLNARHDAVKKFKRLNIARHHLLAMITLAALCVVNDKHFIFPAMKLKAITCNRTTSYLDLTGAWKDMTMLADEYDESAEFLLMNSYNDTRIMVFTDGSVTDLRGGYGVFITSWQHYINDFLDSVDPDKWVDKYVDQLDVLPPDAPQAFCHTMIEPLSQRCSIDFCEAFAIRDSIFWFADIISNKKPCIFALPIGTIIHIISDSATVLGWISGEYKVHDRFMQDIIDDIHWNAGIIQEAGFGVCFQWVRAHQGTLGNELADRLAKLGNLEVDKRKFTKLDNWKYISGKAIKNLDKQTIMELVNFQWVQYINNTTYGGLFLKGFPGDVRHYRWENDNLSRIDVKWLLALRSGHDWFNKYQFEILKKGTSALCTLCNCGSDQTGEHLLLHCTHPSILLFRGALRGIVQTIYMDYYFSIDGPTSNALSDHLASLPLILMTMEAYLFPDMLGTAWFFRNQILKKTINFFGYVRYIINGG